jgi:hypothetical protein
MKFNSTICLYSMHIAFKKSKASLNSIVSHDTCTVCGQLLTEWTTESESFWTAAAIDCQRAISDVMISDECRHTNCSSYVQMWDRQYNSSAITHFSLSEPLTPLFGTPGFCGTKFQKYCTGPLQSYQLQNYTSLKTATRIS